jgi:two-component system, cell cycle response regulator
MEPKHVKTRRRFKTGQEPRVLLVDSDPEHCEELAITLRPEGFRVVTVSRYDAAESLYGMFAPDLAVVVLRSSDPQPVMTGRRLWQLSRKPLPLFYAMSPECPLRASCFGRGHAVGVLPLPLPVGELIERINGLLALKQGIQRASDTAAGERHSFFHDSTTGLFSRQYLLAQVAQELRRSERHGGAFSLVNLTLPAYGRIKRRAGRGTSERLLIWAAGRLMEMVRAADVVARTGEDEFSVLMPAAEHESVGEVVGRLAIGFEAARFQLSDESLQPRVCVGVATFPDVHGSAPQLLEAAVMDRRRRDFQKLQIVTRVAR